MSTIINSKAKSGEENFPKMEKQKLMSSYLGEVKKAPLKTIQPTADRRLCSPKSKPVKKLPNKIFADKGPLKIFEDKPRVFQESGVQTDRWAELERGTQTEVTGAVGTDNTHPGETHNDSGIDQEAYELMVKDPVPESYWRELAEERRLSLAEALSENEMLHQSMEEMKEENLNLSQMAGQAEYLATVLNSLVGEEDEEKEETSKDEDKPDAEEHKDTDSSEVFTTTKEPDNDTVSKDETSDTVEKQDEPVLSETDKSEETECESDDKKENPSEDKEEVKEEPSKEAEKLQKQTSDHC